MQLYGCTGVSISLTVGLGSTRLHARLVELDERLLILHLDKVRPQPAGLMVAEVFDILLVNYLEKLGGGPTPPAEARAVPSSHIE